jgi:branched-chain amino acid transport system substrate-binding protein
MTLSRRQFLKSSAAGVAGLSAASVAPRFAASQSADKIRVGTILDLSGPLQPFGTQKSRVLQMVVEEINGSGGLLGKQIELVSYDAQSNNQLYAQYAQQLALRDRVAVVHAGLQSSSREVIRPVLRRSNVLYFYNTPYEGGVCDRNTFCTGTTPEQLLKNLLPYMVKRFGKKMYVLAADYNFGQLSEKWTRKLAKDMGAEVVASEFFPLDVNQFGPTISKIQAAKPDFLINTFVGPAHAAFYGQWAAAGMKNQIPICSQTFGEGGESVRMPKEITEGIVICYSYIDEIDTPANKAFVDKFKARHPDYGYIGDLAVAELLGLRLWAEGVKKAGSVDREAVIKALETGLSIDAPQGKVTMDPQTHHCVFNMYLAECKSGRFEILQKFDQVGPTNQDGVCDLIKNPATNQQFEPKI